MCRFEVVRALGNAAIECGARCLLSLHLHAYLIWGSHAIRFWSLTMYSSRTHLFYGDLPYNTTSSKYRYNINMDTTGFNFNGGTCKPNLGLDRNEGFHYTLSGWVERVEAL